MQAAVVTQFGKKWHVAVRDVRKPVPGPGELLVRVHATTVNRTDLGEIRHPILNRIITRANVQRAILGFDFAGVVEAVGPGVTKFQPNDRLFGLCPLRANGAHAEYVCIAEDGWLAELSPKIPFGQAVVCEGAFYASASINSLSLAPGSAILIYGASGAIGSAAVQLAKLRGYRITAAVQPQHLEMARALGADRLIDTQSEDYRRLGAEFDFVLDSVGKMTAAQWRPLLKPDGVFATTDAGPKGQSLLLYLWSMITRSGRVTIPVPARGSAKEFIPFLKRRMDAGDFKAVIDRSFPLARITDAIRYVETGQKAGIVAIEVAA